MTRSGHHSIAPAFLTSNFSLLTSHFSFGGDGGGVLGELGGANRRGLTGLRDLGGNHDGEVAQDRLVEPEEALQIDGHVRGRRVHQVEEVPLDATVDLLGQPSNAPAIGLRDLALGVSNDLQDFVEFLLDVGFFQPGVEGKGRLIRAQWASLLWVLWTCRARPPSLRARSSSDGRSAAVQNYAEARKPRRQGQYC